MLQEISSDATVYRVPVNQCQLVSFFAFLMVSNPIMGGINTGLNNALTGMGSSSKVVLGIVLGGMMAIDMGGSFNKAA